MFDISSPRCLGTLLGAIALVAASSRCAIAQTEPAEAMRQVTSVSQLQDVRPTDWAFQALQGLVERYGCIAGYPNQTFRGNRSLSRYEFAAAVSSCMSRVDELISSNTNNGVSQADLGQLKALQTEFATELSTVSGRLDDLRSVVDHRLDDKVKQLESQQFSVTTKMAGFSVIGFQGRTGNEGDRAPRDGTPDTPDPGTNVAVVNQNYLAFTTQITPTSNLYTAFLHQNGTSSAPSLTNDGKLGWDLSPMMPIVSDLNYRFMVTPKIAAIVGTEGVYPSIAFRGPNRYEDAFNGPISKFAQRNPILDIGFGRGGAGLDWQFSKRASLQAVYSSDIPGVFPKGGNEGHAVVGAQLALTPIDPLDITLYYLNDYSPNGNWLTSVGDDQFTAINPSTGTSAPLRTHAFGSSVNWQVNQKLAIGGWLGLTNSHIPGQPGNVTTSNYMVYANLKDALGQGNLAGIYIGQPPKITSSNLPIGNNVPGTLNNGLGAAGGQPGSTLHIESFLRWQVNPNVSITPGLVWVMNPGHTDRSEDFVVGTVRTTFMF
jgi:Carbohydrate-selective porin, OprB family/S-layer homology domain